MTTTERAYLPPIVCKPWCCYGDGHPDLWARDDQSCWTEMLTVPLTLEDKGSDGEFDQLILAGGQNVEDTEPKISIEHSHSGPGRGVFYVTIDEARQLIEALQLVIGQVTA